MGCSPGKQESLVSLHSSHCHLKEASVSTSVVHISGLSERQLHMWQKGKQLLIVTERQVLKWWLRVCVCVCVCMCVCVCVTSLFGFVLNQIPEALGYVRQALQLQGDDANSLHLLALLLSAQKHYHDALNIIDMALSEYPENFM